MPAHAEKTWLALADEIERIFRDLHETAAAFQASYTTHADRYTLGDLAAMRPRIHETLDAFRDLAVGTGIVVAPGILSDAPHWLEWWWRQTDGTVEALRVNLDPDAPDYFDYRNDEWFDVPIRTRRQHVVGPYVDYACTNQYTFTLAVPVHHGDLALGVVAMDVLCDRLERLIMPALCAEPTPRALLNRDGRIVAANAAGLYPGSRLGSDEAEGEAADHSGALARLCSITGWKVAAPAA